VVAQLGDQEAVFGWFVDDPVLIIDAAGPIARQGMPQRFRFAYSLEGVPADLLEESIDALERLAVMPLPMEVIVPGFLREDQSHGSMRCSWPWPASRVAMERSRRLALAGLRSR